MAAIKDPENTLIMETTQGNVVIALRPDLAPKHVERIKQLAREGFYDGIVFHRVIDGFMAQTGCPKGTGTGGSKYPNLPAEFNAEKHVRGVCSMARSQAPNSANSQFFIMLAPTFSLDHKYTGIGRVVSGMQFVDQIAPGEPPAEPTKIVRAWLDGPLPAPAAAPAEPATGQPQAEAPAEPAEQKSDEPKESPVTGG